MSLEGTETPTETRERSLSVFCNPVLSHMLVDCYRHNYRIYDAMCVCVKCVVGFVEIHININAHTPYVTQLAC